MSDLGGFDIIFPREYLRAALLVSLLSVWVLVGLFYYLNRYTKRHYFTIWTAAWLFYALWLTIGIGTPHPAPDSFVIILREWCISISAVFLLWGSLSFLDLRASQTLFGLFMVFLLIWSYAGTIVTRDHFYVQVPTFALIGFASMFAGFSFYRLRRHRQFVAVGMLFLGFFLWGVYLLTYPFVQRYAMLVNAGIMFSAVLQLFIAVSMIVLVLEEARHINQQVLQEVETIHSEKRQLQLKVLSAEEQCRSLFHEAQSREQLQVAYNELRQTQQSVTQQERLRALGQMASGMAHDINNSLSPILAFSELLLRKEPGLCETSRRNLGHIRTSAEDIAQIVARMSDFYRRREHKDQLAPFSLSQMAQQVVELTSPCWRDMSQKRGAPIEVHVQAESELPELCGNESELREALTNIVLNAVDALPNGGAIRMQIRGVTEGTTPAHQKHTHLVLEVSDNGVGMDEITRQRCLEPFFSTKRNRGGSGLGLAMAYGAVERHEGKIEVRSELNRGTTFRLSFPLRELNHSHHRSAEFSAASPRPLKLLCIDDEPLLRDLLKQILECQQHEVQAADGGSAGLQLFQDALSSGSPFDLVITDLGMPDLNGRQVTERIKAESPGTPVIMLTGWGTTIEADEAGATKADAILSKPPRMGELLETVAKLTVALTRKGA